MKRKTKTNDAGLGDGGRIQEAEGRSPTTRGVATSDILTCIECREPEENSGMFCRCSLWVMPHSGPNGTHLNCYSVSSGPSEIGPELTMDYPLDKPFDSSQRS